jgi:ketosteroid isomerase-like protein
MKKLFLIIIAVSFFAALITAQDMGDLKKKVQMMNDSMAEKMLSGDMESIWKHYSDDVISMPSYEPMMRGLDACKESYKKMSESGMKMTAFKSTVTDVMQDGNTVVDIGTYELTIMIPQMGDQPWSDHGKYMTIWEMQEDGSLKVKVETWNTDVNPWMEMEKKHEGEGEEGHKH